MSGTDASSRFRKRPSERSALDRVDVREPGQVADDRADRAAPAAARRQRVPGRARAAHLDGDLAGELEHLPVEEEEAGEPELARSARAPLAAAPSPRGDAASRGSGPRTRARRPRAAARPGSRSRRRSRGSGSRAPRSGRTSSPAAISAVRSDGVAVAGEAVDHLLGREQDGLVVAAPLGLAAVERGAAADRDERVLEGGCGARGGRGRRRSRPSATPRSRASSLERGVPAGVAALVRALELDVEAVGPNAAATRAAPFGSCAPSPCRAQPERQTSPSFSSSSDCRAAARAEAARPRPSAACRRAPRSAAGRGSRSPSGVSTSR